MEVVEALASVWGGGNRVAVRIGPAGTWNHMSDSNPDVLFDYVARQLNRFGLAYLHIIEPRVKGNVLIADGQGPVATERLRKIFRGRIVAAGGFEPETAEAIVEKGDADAVAFGRHFLANPDFVAAEFWCGAVLAQKPTLTFSPPVHPVAAAAPNRKRIARREFDAENSRRAGGIRRYSSPQASIVRQCGSGRRATVGKERPSDWSRSRCLLLRLLTTAHE